MPASISRDTYNYGEALSKPIFEENMFRQTFASSPILATLLGMDADRAGKGLKAQSIKFGTGAYIAKRLQTGTTTNTGNIALTASVTTSMDVTAVEKPFKTIYGDYACYYAYMPCDLDMWIRGGDGADNPLIDAFSDIISLQLTQNVLDGILSDGSANQMDGFQKWTSESANKWGIDTSQGANAYYRGISEAEAEDDFSPDLLRHWILKAEQGAQGSGALKYSTKKPELGIVDYDTFEKMEKWVYDKQAIWLPQGKGYAALGGFHRRGIIFDDVSFFPDSGLNRLKDDNASQGEIFIVCPDTFQIYMHKDFAFKVNPNPGQFIGDGSQGPRLDWIINPTVLWGQYVKMLLLINMFCKRCRNNLYAQLTA